MASVRQRHGDGRTRRWSPELSTTAGCVRDASAELPVRDGRAVILVFDSFLKGSKDTLIVLLGEKSGQEGERNEIRNMNI